MSLRFSKLVFKKQIKKNIKIECIKKVKIKNNTNRVYENQNGRKKKWIDDE